MLLHFIKCCFIFGKCVGFRRAAPFQKDELDRRAAPLQKDKLDLDVLLYFIRVSWI